MTMPAATYVVTRGYKPGVTDKVYASRADGAARRGVDHWRRAGARWPPKACRTCSSTIRTIRTTSPTIAARNGARWAWMPDQALADDIAADNASLAGLDRRGSRSACTCAAATGRMGQWHTAGGYERIAEQVFGGLDVDRFLLEYDSERAGGFEPLRFMPRGKLVVLGLVTTKSAELESQDELLRRIDEASRYVPIENLALSPQCGFASTLVGNPLSWDDQRRKLELVVETARRVWG